MGEPDGNIDRNCTWLGCRITYKCQLGYQLVGPRHRYCQAKGNFTPDTIPDCVHKTTPLHSLARTGNLSVIRSVLEDNPGINLMLFDEYFNTPLELAAKYNTLPVVQYLVEVAGARVKDYLSYKPVEWRMPLLDNAEYLTDKSVAFYLQCIDDLSMDHFSPDGVLTKKSSACTMLVAVTHSELTNITRLVEGNGANLTVTYKDSTTPLHLAARFNTLPVVRYFVEDVKVSVRVKDNDLKTPIDYAEYNEDKSVAKYLKCIDNLSPGQLPLNGVLKQKLFSAPCISENVLA